MMGDINTESVYNLNAILPGDIAVVSLRKVRDDAHCRFDALSRQYRYTVYSRKDPFISDRAYFFPYAWILASMNEAAEVVKEYTRILRRFAKRNSQVKTFKCSIVESDWR